MSDETAERETLYCPECGHNGAFDGMGHEFQQYEKYVGNGDEMVEVAETLSRHHCPNCGSEFLTVEKQHEQ